MTAAKTAAVTVLSGACVLVIGGGIAAAVTLSGGNAPNGQTPAGDQITQSTSAAASAPTPTSTAPAASSPVSVPTVRSLTKHATVKQQEVTVTDPTTSDVVTSAQDIPTDSPTSPSTSDPRPGPYNGATTSHDVVPAPSNG